MIYDLRGLESFPTVPHVDGVLSSGSIQPNNGIVENNIFYIWNSVVKTIYLAKRINYSRGKAQPFCHRGNNEYSPLGI